MQTEAPFLLDFTLDTKASPREDGTVYIEGYASDFGVDRQDEAFEKGAFEAGMKSFMESNPVLLYHHKSDQALGQVIEFEHRPKGLWVKARVDEAEPGTPLADVVRKIKTGTIRGFSVGGRFHRKMTNRGPRIHTADIAELSVTPFPINPRTMFAVAQKAFDDSEPTELESIVERVNALTDTFADLDEKAPKVEPGEEE